MALTENLLDDRYDQEDGTVLLTGVQALVRLRPLPREIEAEFRPGARYICKLHPPLLRAFGLKRKITLGPWFAVGYRMHYVMRRLRGTSLDPFGDGQVRRVARQLIAGYHAAVERLLKTLRPDPHARAVPVASPGDAVRGHEQIKLRNVALSRERMDALLGGRAR